MSLPNPNNEFNRTHTRKKKNHDKNQTYENENKIQNFQMNFKLNKHTQN